MPFLPPETDEPIAQLTLAGRNLLARSIVPRGKLTGTEDTKPLVTFKLAGFAVGDGGYDLSNPLKVTPINITTSIAQATIAILDNRFDVNDNIRINGVDFAVGIVVVESGSATGGTESGGPSGGGTLTVAPGTLAPNAHIGQRLRLVGGGTLTGLDERIISNTDSEIEIGVPPSTPKTWTEAGGGGLIPDVTTQFEIITEAPGSGSWVPGATLEATADNLADAINASTHPLIQNVVKASAVNAIITIEAIAAGSAGNLNTLVEFDEGGLGINNFGVLPGTGVLEGGADPDLESPRFPSNAPVTVEDFFDVERPNSSAVSLVCRVPQTEGNFGLGEVGIYVDIIDSINPAEIGSRILYAVGHFPIVAKNSKSVFVTRVITQY